MIKNVLALIGFIVVLLYVLSMMGLGDFAILYGAPGSNDKIIEIINH